MEFFNSAIEVLQTLVVALGAGLGVWGAINLLEGYGNDNPGSKSQGMKQLMAGGGVALVGITLIPLLSGLFGYGHSKGNTPDGEKPEAVSRTLKTEYHSLGQNNETSVIRGPAIKKAGWLKGQ